MRPSPSSLLPADERAARIAAMDWATLHDEVVGCTACRLAETRRNAVFGVGHPQAEWMIVGEAPGEQEDRTGRPFVGVSGQLLDRMLAACGRTRDDDVPARQVFIANTLKCRPPGNRNPQPDELAACAPFLARQIELVGPKRLVAMGRFAVQHLLASNDAIGRLRGRVHRSPASGGRPVVVTYHPAYLLRQPADKAKAWADLRLAMRAEPGEPESGAG